MKTSESIEEGFSVGESLSNQLGCFVIAVPLLLSSSLLGIFFIFRFSI